MRGNIAPIQTSFSAGELTPKMGNRPDVRAYKSACKTLENFIPDSRGPAISRLGTKFQGEFDGDDARAFAIQGGVNTFFVVILTDLAATVLQGATLVDTDVTPYPEAELHNVHIVTAPNGKDTYFFHSDYAPQKLSYVPSGATEEEQWVWSEPTFTSIPPTWVADNYPATGCFFQGRLWAGGVPSEPQTFWGSKSGEFENFTVGVSANDAIEVAVNKSGAIVWMIGTKNLLLGTIDGEHIVTSEGGVITPNDIAVTQQSAYGSAGVQPAVVGDQVMYVSPDRTKLRAMQYEWTADNWLSKDLTFFSDHITAGKIRGVAWQQNPQNRFWCVMDDGQAAVMVYDRSEEIWGWYRHVTDGTLKDVAIGRQNGNDIAIVAAQRLTGKLCFETEPESATDSDDNVYLDSFVEVTGSDLTEITGLDHIEGKTVQVLVDGAIQPDKVVSGGSITIQGTGDVLQAGLKYTPKLVSLPLDEGSQLGSAQPFLQRYSKIYVSILASALPLINGTRSPTRKPSTPMNTREPNDTELVQAIDTGWLRQTEVTIEQDLPLALTVLSFSGIVAQENI